MGGNHHRFFHLVPVAVGDEKLSFSLCTGELQGGFLLPSTLGVAHPLQAVRVTNAEAKNFVIALEIAGDSTDLREEREEQQQHYRDVLKLKKRQNLLCKHE